LKIENFLFKTDLIDEVNVQVNNTMRAFIFIQEAWRRHRIALRARNDCFSSKENLKNQKSFSFFENQKDIMSGHFIKKKALQTGLFKDVVKRLMQSGAEWTAITKRVIDLYMAR